MKFTEIRLKNFGQFNDETIKLQDGIHLIYGENETGKSTIHSFIKGMLFGIEKPRGRSSKIDMYAKYQPWDNPADYTGTMDITVKNKEYRIYRNFNKDNKTYSVVELKTGREVPISSIKGVSFIENLTEDNYRNTVSIEQCKARTDKELAEEVSNYIANLSTTGNHQVNAGKALEFLAGKRKSINLGQIEQKISELEKLIEKDTQDEFSMEQLYVKKQKIKEKIESEKKIFHNEATKKLEEYIAEFSLVKEAYENYTEAEYTSYFDDMTSEKHTNKLIYLIPMAVLLVLSMVLFLWRGWRIDNFIYVVVGVVVSLIFTYILIKRDRKNSSEEEVESWNNDETEKQQIKMEAEEYIIQYGSRICDFDQIDESSMALLEKEINELENQLNKKKMKMMRYLEEIKLEYERIKWEIETYEQKESDFYEHKNKYEEYVEIRKSQEKELKAIDIAKNMIQEIGSEIHDRFGHNLNKAISENVFRETNGKYEEIKIDEKLNIKVLSDGKFVELDKLSVGTIEQIYLALRLASANMLYGEEIMPLLFDDAFAFYDDRRLSATLEMLGKEKDRQILIFTCHKREEEILKTLNIPYIKRSLSV